MSMETPAHQTTMTDAPFQLRPRPRDEALTPETPRFHIFLIDTGWNPGLSKVLREQMPLFHAYHPQDPVYLLSKEQSIDILKRAPDHIGKDPMVLVYDTHIRSSVRAGKKENYHGFRLNLGIIRHTEHAVAKLQEFLKFIAQHRTADCMAREVERKLHREGLSNMVDLLREAGESSLELL